MFVIEASQRLYLRWDSSPMPLKSQPIKGVEDLKKKQKYFSIQLCHYSVNFNSAKNLGFISSQILEILGCLFICSVYAY